MTARGIVRSSGLVATAHWLRVQLSALGSQGSTFITVTHGQGLYRPSLTGDTFQFGSI